MKLVEQKIKYFGIYQLLGGVIGVLNILRLLPNFKIIDGGILLIFIVFFGLYFYSSFCGYLLIQKQYLRGLNFSIFNQLIQVIGFGALGYAFHFTAGIYCGMKLNLTHDTIVSFIFGHSAAMINWKSYQDFTELSINFIALILINFIFRLKTKLEQNMINEGINVVEYNG